MAHKFNPNNNKTLSVITKSDLVDKDGESKIINFIKKRKIQMKLKWIIIRNLKQKKLKKNNIDQNILEIELLFRRL